MTTDLEDSTNPQKHTSELELQAAGMKARLAAFEEGFDPKEKMPKHISKLKEEIVIIEDKMGRFYIGFYNIHDKWWWWQGVKWLKTDEIRRWYPLPGRKAE